MNKDSEELMHEQKLKYYKRWRANNKEKIKEYNKKFWLKKMEEENKDE